MNASNLTEGCDCLDWDSSDLMMNRITGLRPNPGPSQNHIHPCSRRECDCLNPDLSDYLIAMISAAPSPIMVILKSHKSWFRHSQHRLEPRFVRLSPRHEYRHHPPNSW